jgi:hypothetical protein
MRTKPDGGKPRYDKPGVSSRSSAEKPMSHRNAAELRSTDGLEARLNAGNPTSRPSF